MLPLHSWSFLNQNIFLHPLYFPKEHTRASHFDELTIFQWRQESFIETSNLQVTDAKLNQKWC